MKSLLILDHVLLSLFQLLHLDIEPHSLRHSESVGCPDLLLGQWSELPKEVTRVVKLGFNDSVRFLILVASLEDLIVWLVESQEAYQPLGIWMPFMDLVEGSTVCFSLRVLSVSINHWSQHLLKLCNQINDWWWMVNIIGYNKMN